KVVLLFLLPGHSHNAADRVVAWCRNKMKGVNLYAPNEIVAKMNESKSVRAQFIDHRSHLLTFFYGWPELLYKYFTNMTSGYTENYFFEIDGGIVSMKHLVTTPDEDVQHHSLI
ncbi:hypothetical protein F443_04225, partial [Phytophthora nicotianae P1569]